MARRAAASRPTRTSRRVRLLIAPAIAATMLAAAGPALAAPTCSDIGPWETHGDHVVNDYVTAGDVGWPPDGSELGADVAEQSGASTPGGPAHFDMDVPPGASFCVDSQASSVPRP